MTRNQFECIVILLIAIPNLIVHYQVDHSVNGIVAGILIFWGMYKYLKTSFNE